MKTDDDYAHAAQIDGPCSLRAIRQALKDAGLELQKQFVIPENWGMQAELALSIALLKLVDKLNERERDGSDPKTQPIAGNET